MRHRNAHETNNKGGGNFPRCIRGVAGSRLRFVNPSRGEVLGSRKKRSPELQKSAKVRRVEGMVVERKREWFAAEEREWKGSRS
jgi:hypothetical protein